MFGDTIPDNLNNVLSWLFQEISYLNYPMVVRKQQSIEKGYNEYLDFIKKFEACLSDDDDKVTENSKEEADKKNEAEKTPKSDSI